MMTTGLSFILREKPMRFVQLGGILHVLFGVLWTIGLIVLLMLLLTLRDRRASRAQAFVLDRTWSRETMGLIGMRVISNLLSRKCVVILDVLPCPREQLWLLLEGVAAGTPRGVEILIHATLSGRPLTLRAASEPAPSMVHASRVRKDLPWKEGAR
jgi:hypothetical protein